MANLHRKGRPTIKSADMIQEMQDEIIEITQQAMNTNTIERDIAQKIKGDLDNKYGAYWHVIVGKSFGSYVSHETKCFLYFSIDLLSILIFRH